MLDTSMLNSWRLDDARLVGVQFGFRHFDLAIAVLNEEVDVRQVEAAEVEWMFSKSCTSCRFVAR